MKPIETDTATQQIINKIKFPRRVKAPGVVNTILIRDYISHSQGKFVRKKKMCIYKVADGI